MDFFWIFEFFLLDILDFLGFFGFFSKLLGLLLNVMEVTTEHQEWPIIGTTSVKSSVEGGSPLQELEVSLRSGLYLLVCYKGYIQKASAAPNQNSMG